LGGPIHLGRFFVSWLSDRVKSVCSVRRRLTIKELVNVIARALVDRPDEVRVDAHGAPVTVIELRVNPEDLGKIIGRQGRTAKSIRTLLAAAGSKQHKRFTLEIVED
jgi:predicted RNA-binding protein YlqC (UPF0109 family)